MKDKIRVLISEEEVEARICQLHTKAIMRLRGSLGQEKADFC